MIQRNFQEKTLPLLGFGAMRLPITEGGKAKDIDEKETEKMIRLAMENGVNYFDTAYPYHDGESESVLGRILSRYPRESYFLADKYPGHQIADRYDPAEVFEDQLKKCKVDYFDFYLIHNVYENSIHTYKDARWGIVEYFIEQKKKGRIRHLGFSTHGGLDILTDFLDTYGEHMEFCQIQLNYLDWTLQNAAAKVALLNERNIPIWVMEPLRGGKLANLGTAEQEMASRIRPGESAISLAFRFLQGIDGVYMILSGMSNSAQLRENLQIFGEEKPLTDTEKAALFAIAENLKRSVPCTACRYCISSCPRELDIPLLLSVYNELQVVKTFNTSMRIESLPEEKKPQACIGCGKCEKLCPQHIAIPECLSALSRILKDMPSWEAISRERGKLAEQNRNKNQ